MSAGCRCPHGASPNQAEGMMRRDDVGDLKPIGQPDGEAVIRRRTMGIAHDVNDYAIHRIGGE
jgi:hypothetical protein